MKKIIVSFLLLFLFFSCSSKKGTEIATEDLKNTRWKLIELNSKNIIGVKTDLTIVFNLHSTDFTAFGGCNNIYGIYETNGNKLTLTAINMTKINCTDGEDKYEYEYVNTLKTVDNFKIIQKYLYLYKGDKLVAKFEATFLY